jgi:hypothetical protein
MRDDRVRAALERLADPPERDRFFDELWEKAEANARRAARRWRRTSLVFAGVVVAASTAAGVLALGRANGPALVDRTLSCPSPNLANLVLVFAYLERTHALGYGNNRRPPEWGAVGATAEAVAYAAVGPTFKSGYTFDLVHCRPVPAIPLNHVGLPPPATFEGTDGEGNGWNCRAGRTFAVRLHATLTQSGRAVAVTLAIRSLTRARPVAYVEWTPTRFRAWLGPECTYG